MRTSRILSVVVLFASLASLASASVPQLVPLQGRLMDSGGLLQTGSYTMLFSIYDVSSGGSSLWSETQTVSVNSGAFAVQLGSNVTLSLDFYEQLWVGVKVGSDSEMTPRIKLGSSPYARVADAVNGSGNVFPGSGNVGIGTLSPGGLLHIYRGASGQATVNTAADELVLENAGNAGLTILTRSSDKGYLIFGDDGSNIAGQIYYDHTTNAMTFRTNGANDRLTIDSTGNVGIGTTSPGEKLEVAGDIKFTGGDLKTGAISLMKPVYIRGTGNNHIAVRLVKLGNDTLVSSASRGLTLTIITAATHAHVSSTNYDTYGLAANSDNLATALNNLTRAQIGILTSYDAWEASVTANLRTAARRLGLFKLGAYSAGGSRRPYAAMFYGSGTSTGNAEPGRQAIEVMASDDVDAPYALISTWLIEDSFSNQNLPSALVSANSQTVDPVLMVDSAGNVGVGTTSPSEKFEVTGKIYSSGGYELPNGLSIGHRSDGSFATNSMNFEGTNSAYWMTLNDGLLGIGVIDPKNKLDVEGAVAIGATYSGTNTAPTNGLLVEGNVGIGTTGPGAKLEVLSTTNPQLRVAYDSNSYATIGAADGSDLNIAVGEATGRINLDPGSSDNYVTLLGGAQLISYSSDNAEYGVIYHDGSDLRITTAGTSAGDVIIDKNVGIGTTSPASKLDVAGGTITIQGDVQLGLNLDYAVTSLLATNWYRIATLSNSNQAMSVKLKVANSARHTNTIINIDKGTGYYVAEVYEGGRYTYPQNIKNVRIVNAGVNNYVYVDVQVGADETAGTFTVLGDYRGSTVNGLVLDAFVDQGTAAAGHVYPVTSVIRSFGDSVSAGPILTLKEGGNIGIGTSSPGEKLEVAGNIKLTGNITSAGDICIGNC